MRKYFFIVAALALTHCGLNRISGTTDETLSGTRAKAMLHYANGSPVPGAKVRFFAADDTSQVPKAQMTTDNTGHYSLASIPNGAYSFWAEKDSLIAYQDSVIFSSSNTTLKEDTVRESGSITATVRMQPNDDPRDVYVQILGSDRYSNNVDADGKFTISGLAKGKYRIKVSSTKQDYTSTVFTVLNQSGLADTLKVTLALIYTGIPVVTGLRATYDTLHGLAYLTWNKPSYSYLQNYLIYKDEFSSTNKTKLPVAITDTFFVDTVFKKSVAEGRYSFSDTNDYHYKYGVSVLNTSDQEGNTYRFLDIVATSPTILWPRIQWSGGDTIFVRKDDPANVLAGAAPRASDKLWGNLTDSIKTAGNFFASVCSTFTLTYSVTNPAGYKTEKSRTIIVDCVRPEIVLKGNNPMELPRGSIYVEPGAEATDNIDPSGILKIATTGSVDTAKEGSDTIFYSVSDRAGNTGTQKRIVLKGRLDTIPPVITILGCNPCTLNVGQEWVDPGYMAYDEHDGLVTHKVIRSGALDGNLPGTYSIRFSITDEAGNIGTAIRSVVVLGPNSLDTEPPVITFLGCNPCTLNVGQEWVDPGYTAWDDHDGDVTSKVIRSGTPNSNLPGGYLIRYSVADSTGKIATYIRSVVVVGHSLDTIRPVITFLGCNPCSLNVAQQWVDPGYTAYDDHDGDVTSKVIRSGTPDSNLPGTYSIQYSVVDSTGNIAMDIRSVVVVGP